MKALPRINTYSIVACDQDSLSWGIAVASKFLAVGAVVPYARAEIGAIATQAAANLSFGPRGLDLLAEGKSAAETLSILLAQDEQREERQVGIVDAHGRAATFTGANCMSWAGGRCGPGYAVQGNILVGEATIIAMAAAFEQAKGEIAARLYAALTAGDVAGGDRRGKQSASLLVVQMGAGYSGYSDKYIDLRVDDHDNPVGELGRLMRLHQVFFGSTPAEQRIMIDRELAREFQRLLARLGYYHGEVTGEWDQATQRAFSLFAGRENLEERVDVANRTIDPPALDYIRNTFASSTA